MFLDIIQSGGMHSEKHVCCVFGTKALVILCDPPWDSVTGTSWMLYMLDFESTVWLLCIQESFIVAKLQDKKLDSLERLITPVTQDLERC